MGRLPTIALKADGWSAVECFKKDRKSCHESVFINGGCGDVSSYKLASFAVTVINIPSTSRT